jgi:hypothetical protein
MINKPYDDKWRLVFTQVKQMEMKTKVPLMWKCSSTMNGCDPKIQKGVPIYVDKVNLVHLTLILFLVGGTTTLVLGIPTIKLISIVYCFFSWLSSTSNDLQLFLS